MRKFDWDLVLDDRGLALLTVPDFNKTGEIYIADFRDTQALAFKKTKHFIGMSKIRGARLGGHPLRMMDGIWYITEDNMTEVNDFRISPKEVYLQLIR